MKEMASQIFRWNVAIVAMNFSSLLESKSFTRAKASITNQFVAKRAKTRRRPDLMVLVVEEEVEEEEAAEREYAMRIKEENAPEEVVADSAIVEAVEEVVEGEVVEGEVVEETEEEVEEETVGEVVAYAMRTKRVSVTEEARAALVTIRSLRS